MEQQKQQNQHSSLVARLNARLLVRVAGIYFCMDLLLTVLCLGGVVVWAEGRCADVAALVDQRGVPSAEATEWMQAGDYTVTALDRDIQGWDWSWLPLPDNTREGLRSLSGGGGTLLFNLRWGEGRPTYTVELIKDGQPYAISLDLDTQVRVITFAVQVLLICQVISLISNLFKNAGTIRKVLRPIQDLAAAASRLGNVPNMSPEELQKLAARLGEIDDAHLDARLPVDGTQKELKNLAQAINAMLDRIDQSYRAQMRFVSDASHELRTPISVIQGYANLLNRWGKDDPEAMQESIDAITQEAQSMKELVEQLLFLARGDNDSLVVEPEVFDLTAVAGQVMRDSQVIDQTHPMEAHWEGPVFVNCDLGLTKQAIRILVDNAIKYTPNGGAITMTVEEKEGMAHLSVTDEGIGISPEALPHIFDRFFRADESRTRQTGGSGLGLSIAKWIVERHGGWFDVVSRQNVGTKMTIVLPTVPMPAAPDGSEAVETNHLEIR